jgi:hypothetical protein
VVAHALHKHSLGVLLGPRLAHGLLLLLLLLLRAGELLACTLLLLLLALLP